MPATAPVAPTATSAFDYSGTNYAIPTINAAPVNTDTPSAVTLYGQTNPDTGEVAQAPDAPAKPVMPGTNPGAQAKPSPAYQTASPSQSSFNWGTQTSGSGTTPTPVNPAAQQAWGTGNGTAQAQFDPQAYISWLMQPSVQQGFAGMAYNGRR